MTRGTREFAEMIRRRAHREARHASPPMERFVVLRRSPLLLESYSSDLKLSAEDDDFEIARGIARRLKKGDSVWVATDRDGDRIVLAGSTGVGGGGKEAAEDEAKEEAEGLGVIRHGAKAGTDRPNDFANYIWIGSVDPDNAQNDDFLAKPPGFFVRTGGEWIEITG